jgi:hypothetical protein
MSPEQPKWDGWKRVEIAKGDTLHVRAVDPEIMKKMPKTTKTFIQVGPVELLIHDIKKLLNPGKEIPH